MYRPLKRWSYCENGAGCLLPHLFGHFQFWFSLMFDTSSLSPFSPGFALFLKGQHNKERLVADEHRRKRKRRKRLLKQRKCKALCLMTLRCSVWRFKECSCGIVFGLYPSFDSRRDFSPLKTNIDRILFFKVSCLCH